MIIIYFQTVISFQVTFLCNNNQVKFLSNNNNNNNNNQEMILCNNNPLFANSYLVSSYK